MNNNAFVNALIINGKDEAYVTLKSNDELCAMYYAPNDKNKIDHRDFFNKVVDCLSENKLETEE